MVHNALELTKAANGIGLMSPKFFSCRACNTAGIGAHAIATQMIRPNNGQMVVTTKFDSHAFINVESIVRNEEEGGDGTLVITQAVSDCQR